MEILVIPVNIFFVPIFFQKLVFHLLQGFAGVVKESHSTSLPLPVIVPDSFANVKRIFPLTYRLRSAIIDQNAEAWRKTP
ncbi:MAG: hypothetical protein BHW31_05995 [Firmicutes bacterium CAG:110_56_8]|nr:MAG: hypothetical protein BHW31_05995 [Firmicutes bacterium CAG:110_56_8]